MTEETKIQAKIQIPEFPYLPYYSASRCVLELDHGAIMPSYGSVGAIGLDVHLIEEISNDGFPPDVRLFRTGVHVTPPHDHYFELVPRSSLAKSGFSMANSVGIIDEDFTGDILVALRDHKTCPLPPLPWKAMQLVLHPIIRLHNRFQGDFARGERGSGGFGSTDSKELKDSKAKSEETIAEPKEDITEYSDTIKEFI